MRDFWEDLRYGVRIVRKNPGFSAVVALVLALGIGANTAIFSVVYAVLLRPLPFPDPDRIVAVAHVPPQELFPGHKTFSVSPANYFDWKAQADVFESMAIWAGDAAVLTRSGEPTSLPTAFVSADFFSVVPARPLSGRVFAEGDDAAGRRVAVMSEELWKTRFGGDPGIVGSSLVLNGQPFAVVGIVPAGAGYPSPARLWLPLSFSPEERAVRGIHNYEVLARLKRGVSVETAQARMDAISARLAAQYPADDKGWGARVTPLHEDLVGAVRPALLVLLGAVAFVLLIACANVANLVLARTLGRRREIAIRSAIGAGRGRIVRQLFAEMAILSAAGGTLGLAGASLAVSRIAATLVGRMPRAADIRVDGVVLAFTFGVAVATGILAGMIPAWRLTRADPSEALKQGGRSDADAGHPAVRGALVAAEVALALMLLVGAGLLLRSFARLRGVDPGFDPRRVLTATVSLPGARYAEPDAPRQFFDRILARARVLPGVTAAGAIDTLPLTEGGSVQPVAIEGRAAAAMADQPEVAIRSLTPGLLDALRIPLRRGRDLTAADDGRAPAVVLVSEAMAKRFWPGEDAVGKRLSLTFSPRLREVVGVVADVKLRQLSMTAPIAAVYVPHAQQPGRGMSLVLRTAGDPHAAASSLAAAVRALDADVPVEGMHTLEEQFGDSLARTRFQVRLLSVFAGLALALAAVGIFGVLAYAVRRRTREIGIRMALGAQRSDVVRLVLSQGMRPAAAGLAIGLAGSLALGRTVESLLFGVHATDALTLLGASMLLSGVALAACVLPAWRVTRVDPTVSLQES